MHKNLRKALLCSILLIAVSLIVGYDIKSKEEYINTVKLEKEIALKAEEERVAEEEERIAKEKEAERLLQEQKEKEEQARKELQAKLDAEEEARKIAETKAIKDKEVAVSREKKLQATPARSGGQTYTLTAYDLSVESCGKAPGHPYYGITASGYDLSNENLTNRKIAVDPRNIPLGTKVYIEFPSNLKSVKIPAGQTVQLDGYYTAVDTGGAIKGNRIDLYVGGNTKAYHNLAYHIGKRQVKVYK